METYGYRTLDQGSIRLLEFSSFRNQELTFKIHHKKLDSLTTSYTALSYRWGGSGPNPCINIEGSRLEVTSNLEEALVHIKERFAKQSSWIPSLLWIDAICINQSNREEKSHQVALMGEIYSRADRVYVWFGKPSDDRKMGLAVEKLDLLYKLYRSAQMESHTYRPWWWPREKTSMRRDRLAMTSLVYKKQKAIFDVEGTDAYAAWQGIVELWQNKWWQRAWVIQEGTVKEPDTMYVFSGIQLNKPKHKVFFLCGQHTTKWSGLSSAIEVAETLLRMPLLSPSTGLLKFAWGNIPTIIQTRYRRTYDHEVELLEQLQYCRYTGATNPRDKVYANLALVPKSEAALIRPDYNRSVLDVYLDVARVQLEHSSPSLDFLGYAMKLDEPRREPSKEVQFESWPSWIPNWDDPLNVQPLPKKLYRVRDREGRAIRPFDIPEIRERPVVLGPAYNATRNERVTAFISGYTLHIRGMVLDTIVDRYSYQKGTVVERREQINRWWAQRNKLWPNGEDFNVGLLRAQVADVRRETVRKNAFARGNRLNNDLLNKREADLTPEESSAQAEMRICLNQATLLRGLCLTAKGYVGLVPWGAKQGDRVCTLLGGQVLYIIRPRQNEDHRYEYIGECFIHALMDGEAMEWIQRGQTVVEDLILV